MSDAGSQPGRRVSMVREYVLSNPTVNLDGSNSCEFSFMVPLSLVAWLAPVLTLRKETYSQIAVRVFPPARP